VLRLAPLTEREIRSNTTFRLIEPAPTKVPPPASRRLPESSKERSVAQRFSIPRLTVLERFMVEIRRCPLPRHGTDHDSKPLPSFPRFSRCHLPAPSYDQLSERRFEFIPLWEFLVFLLYTMRRVNCRRCGVVAVEEVPWGDGKRTLTKAYMLFLARAGTDNDARLEFSHSVHGLLVRCAPSQSIRNKCSKRSSHKRRTRSRKKFNSQQSFEKLINARADSRSSR